MPRGVYDRSKSKVNRVTVENEKLSKQVDTLRTQLERKETELTAARRLEPIHVRQEEAAPTEMFAVLRENLKSLAESRGRLVDSDSLTPELVASLDAEITAHLSCVTQLREQVFGKGTRAPQAAPTMVGGVPMIPLPETFQSARVAR